MAQTIFSTSSSIEEVTGELPMLALIFTRKLRPMIIGSSSGWLMLAGMMARPRATSSRTNSGVMTGGMAAPKDWPGCWASIGLDAVACVAQASRLCVPHRRDGGAPLITGGTPVPLGSRGWR